MVGPAMTGFVAASAIVFLLSLHAALFNLPSNLCTEGVEHPLYHPVALAALAGAGFAGFPPHYRLLRIEEQGAPRQTPTAVRPVLFAPGNAGYYTQAKSMAAEAAKDCLPLVYYTLDFGGELVAFSPALLWRQACPTLRQRYRTPWSIAKPRAVADSSPFSLFFIAGLFCTAMLWRAGGHGRPTNAAALWAITCGRAFHGWHHLAIGGRDG
jgi:hypothetical protein